MMPRWTFALLLCTCTLSCAGPMKNSGSGGSVATGGADSPSGGATTGGMDGSGAAATSGGGTSPSGGAPSSGGTNPSGGASPSGGAPPTGGSNGVSVTPANCPTTADLGVRLIGRHDGCTAGAVRQAWSGTGFIAHIDGTSLSFDQDGPSVEYTVVVDGAVQNKVVTASGRQTTVAATGLTPGEHTVEVYRRGEASFGTTTLYGIEVGGGSLLPAPPAGRLIEVVGDSISCGYGNEGADETCGFSADTESHYMSYGAILARARGTAVSTVAWSGRGVVSNYDGGPGLTMPELYRRAIPDDDASVWDFGGNPQPELVLINLGTNDYSTDNDPTTNDFVGGYLELLTMIRAHYPDAAILCTVGPLLSGTDLDTARANIATAITTLGDARIRAFEMTTPNTSPGCDWHPSIPTHTAMAAELAPAVADLLGW